MIEKELLSEIGCVETSTTKTMIYRYPSWDEESPDQYYLINNIDAFLRAGAFEQQDQRIIRIIGRTVFLPKRTIRAYKINLDDETAKRALVVKTKNGLLEKAIALGEGADFADQHVFENVEEVIIYNDISNEMHAGGIQCGLGFPGRAFGLIIARVGIDDYVTILEEVESYSEGYSVDRTILTDSIMKAATIASVQTAAADAKKLHHEELEAEHIASLNALSKDLICNEVIGNPRSWAR